MTGVFPTNWFSRELPDRSDSDKFLGTEVQGGSRHGGSRVMATLTLRLLAFKPFKAFGKEAGYTAAIYQTTALCAC